MSYKSTSNRQPGSVRALAELRAFGADVDRLDAAAAAHLGLNRTDLRVMEILNRAGPLNASELAAATELTSAAMTTVIDRLASRDLVARRYDPSDRRRVIVEPTPAAADASRALFADLLAGLHELVTGLSEAELATIISFLSGARAVFASHIEALHHADAAQLVAHSAPASGSRPPRPKRPSSPTSRPAAPPQRSEPSTSNKR